MLTQTWCGTDVDTHANMSDTRVELKCVTAIWTSNLGGHFVHRTVLLISHDFHSGDSDQQQHWLTMSSTYFVIKHKWLWPHGACSWCVLGIRDKKKDTWLIHITMSQRLLKYTVKTSQLFFHIDYKTPPGGVTGPLLRKLHGESLTENNQKGLASSKLCLCNSVLCVLSACFCIYSDWHHTNILTLYVWLSYCKVLAIIWASCVHFETKCEWTWIIHVSKNKRFMQLLFCTKAKPCTQWTAAVEMQGLFTKFRQ